MVYYFGIDDMVYYFGIDDMVYYFGIDDMVYYFGIVECYYDNRVQVYMVIGSQSFVVMTSCPPYYKFLFYRFFLNGMYYKHLNLIQLLIIVK